MNLTRTNLRCLILLCLAATASGSMGLAWAANCVNCHPYNVHAWPGTRHAHSQTNVALGLTRSHAGQTASEALSGTNGMNCIACHAPMCVMTNGGMTEIQALDYYFTTENGTFTTNTQPAQVSSWPHIECTTCHYMPARHTQNPSLLALFNSTTAQYDFMPSASVLCSQCHGNARHPNSGQRLYNAWNTSAHRLSQESVAQGLRQNYAGQTPEQVLATENCIACHAPRASLGWSEPMALRMFFTSSNGVFTADTVAANTNSWSGVDCNSCHDPHSPGVAYFNSTTQLYEPVASAEELCGQCHGTLQFANSRYRSYDIIKQIGGVGVTNQQVMASVTCMDCHMHANATAGSNSKEFHGHGWAVTVKESDGSTTTSCTHCHPSISTYVADAIITAWKNEFQWSAATAQTNVANAFALFGGSPDAAIQAALAEAQQNLALALADESGGVHNHTFSMALVQAANSRVLALGVPPAPTLSATKFGASVQINWSGGTLQQSSLPTGTWDDLTNASNPLLLPPEIQSTQQFFRLKR